MKATLLATYFSSERHTASPERTITPERAERIERLLRERGYDRSDVTVTNVCMDDDRFIELWIAINYMTRQHAEYQIHTMPEREYRWS